MGIIRKILKPLTKESEGMINQVKAILKQDKIEHGEKVLPPKHPTDEKHFKAAQKGEKIKEEVQKRRDDLIQNVNKITIKSFDPPERPKSNRPLPTHETEYEHRNDPRFEYGFYEPPLDKMQPGKLMLREVMELLYAKTEIDMEGKGIEDAQKVLHSHPATSRISAEDIDSLYKYYRPFVRNDTQRVVDRRDLDLISDYMNNRGDFQHEIMYASLEGPERHLQHIKQSIQTRMKELDGKEKSEILEKVYARQMEERNRLEGTLQKEFGEEGLNNKEPASEKALPTKTTPESDLPKETTKK